MIMKFLELSNLETTMNLRQKELLEMEEKIDEKEMLLKAVKPESPQI
jgi:hypothetical protein